MRADPFRDALCRQPGRDPRDWDTDAPAVTREHAAAVCGACPAIEQCAARAAMLGGQASGTWAGVYREWAAPSDPLLAAFVAVFGASFDQTVVVTVSAAQLSIFDMEEA